MKQYTNHHQKKLKLSDCLFKTVLSTFICLRQYNSLWFPFNCVFKLDQLEAQCETLFEEFLFVYLELGKMISPFPGSCIDISISFINNSISLFVNEF